MLPNFDNQKAGRFISKREDMKVRELVKLLYDDRWVTKEQKGSHMQLVHPTKKGKKYSTSSWRRYTERNFARNTEAGWFEIACMI